MESKYMLYIFIVFLIFFIILTLALVGMFFYLIFMNRDKNQEEGKTVEKLVDEIKTGFTKLEDLKKGNFCKLHPGVKAVGTCAVCDEMFCEDCIMEIDKVNLCPEHFRLVNENEWAVVETVKTDSNNPEASMYIYDFKKKMWKENMTPMYIVTHYQINIDDDNIVSQIDLFSKRDEQFGIASDLEKYRNDYFEKLKEK